MSQPNGKATRNVGAGIAFFIIGLVIAIVAGTVLYQSTILGGTIALIVGVVSCLIGIKILATKQNNSTTGR
jgi:hypothetical protein